MMNFDYPIAGLGLLNINSEKDKSDLSKIVFQNIKKTIPIHCSSLL